MNINHSYWADHELPRSTVSTWLSQLMSIYNRRLYNVVCRNVCTLSVSNITYYDDRPYILSRSWMKKINMPTWLNHLASIYNQLVLMHTLQETLGGLLIPYFRSAFDGLCALILEITALGLLCSKCARHRSTIYTSGK